jgi:hypothetical protein
MCAALVDDRVIRGAHVGGEMWRWFVGTAQIDH